MSVRLFFTLMPLALAACATNPTPTPSDEPQTSSAIVVSVPEFLAEQQALRASLETGQPRELRRHEWQKFDQIQAGFEQKLSGIDTIDELSVTDRVFVFNLQEELEALLADSRQEGLVCERVRRLGSNRTHTVCRERSELERDRENSRRFYEEFRARDRGPRPDGT